MYPLLPSGQPAPEWDNRLIADIGFIKKHLRYPIGRYTILPFALLALIIPVLVIIIYLMIIGRHAGDHSFRPFIGIALPVIVGCIFARRAWDMLHFRAVPTPYFATENQLLLLRFLQAHHFAFARHPDAPEVFQIMSKSISALQDEREIIVFIADDRRILINSHFTQNRYKASGGTSHLRQIEGLLERWLAG